MNQVRLLLFVAGIQSDLKPNSCASLVQGVSVYQSKVAHTQKRV